MPFSRPAFLAKRRRNKYGAVASHDMATGRSYDSLGERLRFAELQILERGGVISGLEFKPAPVVLDAAAGIKWRVDYRYVEDGRTVYEDYKPRPMTPRECMLLKMWQAHGPALLLITGMKRGRGHVIRSVMPNMKDAIQS